MTELQGIVNNKGETQKSKVKTESDLLNYYNCVLVSAICRMKDSSLKMFQSVTEFFSVNFIHPFL